MIAGVTILAMNCTYLVNVLAIICSSTDNHIYLVLALAAVATLLVKV